MKKKALLALVLVLVSIMTISAQRERMPPKTWVQTEWTQAQVDLYEHKGDYYSIYNVFPNQRRQLQRLGDWTDIYVELITFEAPFYDEANSRYAWVGRRSGTGYLATAYLNSAFALQSPNAIVEAQLNTGGLTRCNAKYWNGNLYVIASNGYVYRGSDYTTTMATFYETGDAAGLAPHGDQMYMITTGGTVYKLNSDATAFEALHTPLQPYEPLFITSFRGYLLITGRGDDGTIHFYRLSLPAPTTLDELANLPHHTAKYSSNYQPVTVHDDAVYITPGLYTDPTGTYDYLDVYRFNGSQVDFLTTLTDLPSIGADTAIDLLSWRNHLIVHVGTTMYLTQDNFETHAEMEGPAHYSTNYHVFNVGGELLNRWVDGEDPPQPGISHAGSSTGLQDGHIITSKLSFGLPGRQKRLEQITVVLSGAASNFKCVIEYRIDDETSWTTAATINNSRIARATAIDAQFYTLQLRIELDDDTGNDEDIRIDAISVTYTPPQ